MEISVSQQLLEVGLSLLLGFAAGFLYDVFRFLRHTFKLRVVTHILDLLYCIIVSLSLFLLGMAAGNGQQRIGMTAVAFIGGAVYFSFLSKYTILLFDRIGKLMEKIKDELEKPVKAGVECSKKIEKNVKSIFRYNKKWYKIDYKYKKTEMDKNTKHGGSVNETKAYRYSYEDSAGRAAGLRGNVSGKNERKNKRRDAEAGRDTAAGR